MNSKEPRLAAAFPNGPQGVSVADDVLIAENVQFGNHVTVYSKVRNTA